MSRGAIKSSRSGGANYTLDAASGPYAVGSASFVFSGLDESDQFIDVLYPTNAVAKRWSGENQSTLEDYLVQVSETVRDLQARQGGR